MRPSPINILCKPKGFTLIETLVAFMILATSLVVVLQLFSGSLKAITITNDYEYGVFHAQEKIEEILTFKKLDPDISQGEFSDGYKWYVAVSPEKEVRKLNPDTSLILFNIIVKIEWQKFGHTKKYILKTQKLAEGMKIDA